ncbi:MAG TPA: hypothetical protein VK136_06060 [Bacillota bacterium]|nr:hypothetical protein [Bacillota bacterium]
MVGTVVLTGVVLLIILAVLSVIIHKATSDKSYATYYPSFVLFAAGLILLLFATLMKVEIAGVGLGGYGIASLFAAAVCMILMSILEVNTKSST